MAAWLNLPNALTLLRLALVPFILQATLTNEHGRALAIFLAAGFTDLLDGAIARRFGSSTQAGAYLDPIATKVLFTGDFVALAAPHPFRGWFLGLVLGRDVYILAGARLFCSS